MSIPERRKELNIAILNLINKPYLSIPEKIRLKELQEEWKQLMVCGRTKVEFN